MPRRAPAWKTPVAWPFGFEPSLSVARQSPPDRRARRQRANPRGRRDHGGPIRAWARRLSRRSSASGTLSVAHVGDSRLYLLAGPRLRQMTHDDSWMAAVLAADPALDPRALDHHPMRNALTNAVGCAGPQTCTSSSKRSAGGVFALTTDGVHGVLDERGSAGCWRRSEPAMSRAASCRRALAGEPGQLHGCRGEYLSVLAAPSCAPAPIGHNCHEEPD